MKAFPILTTSIFFTKKSVSSSEGVDRRIVGMMPFSFSKTIVFVLSSVPQDSGFVHRVALALSSRSAFGSEGTELLKQGVGSTFTVGHITVSPLRT